MDIDVDINIAIYFGYFWRANQRRRFSKPAKSTTLICVDLQAVDLLSIEIALVQ